MQRETYLQRIHHASQRQLQRSKRIKRRLLAYETLEDRSLMAYDSVDLGHVSIDVNQKDQAWDIKVHNSKSGEKGTLWIRQKAGTNYLEAAYSENDYTATLQNSIPSSSWQSLELTTLTQDLKFTDGSGEVPIVFGSIDTNGYDFLIAGDENFRSDLIVAHSSIIDTVDNDSMNKVGNIVMATHSSIDVYGNLIADNQYSNPNTNPHTRGNITLDSYDRANIADAGPNDRHIHLDGATLRGDQVSITADRINRKLRKQIIGIDTNTVEININSSKIDGVAIDIQATALDTIAFDGPAEPITKWASGFFKSAVLFGVSQIKIPGEEGADPVKIGSKVTAFNPPIAIFDRQASAKVTIKDSDLEAENKIRIATDVQSQSKGDAIATRPFASDNNPFEISVGYGRAKANAYTILEGETKLTTTAPVDPNDRESGSIRITANGQASTLINARTLATYKSFELDGNNNPVRPQQRENPDFNSKDFWLGAVALGLATLDLKTIVGVDTTINAKGNVLVESDGGSSATAYSTTRSYEDGLVGVTFSLGKSNATIETTVDGKIFANGAGLPILYFQKLTSGTDKIPYDPTLGWSRGEIVTYLVPDYDPNASEPIANLKRNKEYYIYEIQQDYLKLVEKMELDLGLPLGDQNSEQSFDVVSTKDFNPQTAINTDTGTFTINSHGWSNGQQVKYQLYGNSTSNASGENTPNEPIGNLTDGEIYYIIKIDENRFKLASTPENVTSNSPIAISGTGKGTVHAFQYVSRNVLFHPRTNLNPDTNTFDFDTQGIQTGDPLIYHVDPSNGREIDFTRQALFSPSESTIEFDPTATVPLDIQVFDLTDNLFFLQNHGLKTGDSLIYRHIEGDPLLTVDQDALLDDTTLYAIVIDGDRIQVARSIADAQSANEIVFEQPNPSQQRFSTATKTWNFDPTASAVVSSVDVQQNWILFSNPHQLVTGQRIVYQPGIGNAPIGGLTAGDSYYVAVFNESLIQLAKTESDLYSGTMVDLTSGATIAAGKHQFIAANTDIVNDWIVTQNHGLQTGQNVVYENVGELSIGGLIPGATYTVIRVDENRIRFASNLANASGANPLWINLTQKGSGDYQYLDISTTVNRFDPSKTYDTVDLTQNTLRIPRASGIDWVTGQKVRYIAAGDPIGGLVDQADYYVIADAPDLIRLASTLADANAKLAIDLTTKAEFFVGNHLLEIVPAIELIGEELDYESFDPSSHASIRPSDHSLRIPAHGYSTGQQVTYLSGAGTSIPELENGKTYFLIALDQDHVQISYSAQEALDGIVIPIQAGATGDRHGFEVPLSLGALDAPIQGLDAEETYYAIVDGPHALRLAKSAVEAFLAVPIQIDTSKWPEWLEKVELRGEENTDGGIRIASVLNSNNDSEAYPTLGGIPSLWEMLSYPEFAFATGLNWKVAFGVPDGQRPRQNYQAGDTTKDKAVSAAVALAYSDHQVTTTVNGVLRTPKNIEVESQINHATKTVAWGGVSSNKANGKDLGVAASLIQSIYVNKALTEIGSTAQIDAGESLHVVSNVVYPRLFNLEDLTSDGFGGTALKLLSHIPALLNNYGLVKFLNVFVNSTSFSNSVENAGQPGENDKNFKVAIAGSIAVTSYQSHSRAIVRDGANINQNPIVGSAQQTDDQQVHVQASTSLELIGLAGEINFDPNFALLRKGVNQFIDQHNPMGAKAKSTAIGASEFFAGANSETVARIEGGALVHSGKKGGVYVVAHEYGRKNVLAQSGAKSDAVGIGLSSGQSSQKSITIAQVAAGATITGGELGIHSSSDSGHIVGSGGILSAGPVGIGLSFGYLGADRHTYAILGDIPPTLLADLDGYDFFTPEDPNDQTSGRIEVTALDVDALNTGSNWNVAIVGAVATARRQPALPPQQNPPPVGNDLLGQAGQPVVEQQQNNENQQNAPVAVVPNPPVNPPVNKSSTAIAGDAVYSNVKDKTLALVDSMRFVHFSILNNDEPTTANLDITSSNETKSWALAGAVAIARREQDPIVPDGSSVAFAGSFAVNRIDWDTKAQLIDSNTNPQNRTRIYVAGNVTINATAGKAPDQSEDDPLDQLNVSLFAMAASVGFAEARGGTAFAGVYSLAVNRLKGETIASIDSANIEVGSNKTQTGDVVVKASNYHHLSGDAGGFAWARTLNNATTNYAAGIGGSNAINILGDKDSDQYKILSSISGQAQVEADEVQVQANDYSKIFALTVAGAVANGLAITESGSQNVIRRTIKSIIGDDDENETPDPTTKTHIKSKTSVSVQSTDHSSILSISGTLQIARRNINDPTGFGIVTATVGAAWSSNRILDESATIATITDADIQPLDPNQANQPSVLVQSNSQAEIYAVTTSLGALYRAGTGDAFNINLAGAIAINQVGGAITATVVDSTVVASDLSIKSLSQSEIQSRVISGQLQLGVPGGLTVGLGVTRNEIETDTLAKLQGSVVILSGDLDVDAHTSSTIISNADNASIEIGSSDQVTGANFSLTWIGVWATNEITGSTIANIESSTVGTQSSRAQSVSVNASDVSTIVAKGFGGRFSLTFARATNVNVGALTQIVENDAATDVQASITQGSVIFVQNDLSVVGNKQVNLASHITAVSIGIAGAQDVIVSVSATTSVVRNNLEPLTKDHKQFASNTHAVIEDSQITAGNVFVNASLSPWVYSKIWEVDIQINFGQYAVAAVYGEAASKTTLQDNTLAQINRSTVTTDREDVDVQAGIDLPAPDRLAELSEIDFPKVAETKTVYADVHSVGVAIAIPDPRRPRFFSFAGVVVRADLDTVSSNSVTSRIVDSSIHAFGDVRVISDDHAEMYGQIKASSVAVGLAAFAASIPNLYLSQENIVSASIETSNDPSNSKSVQSYLVESQTGDIQVRAHSDANIYSEQVVWSASFLVGVSLSTSYNDTYIRPTLKSNVSGGNSAIPLELKTHQRDIRVLADFEGYGISTIKSGSYAVLLGVNTVRQTIEASPEINVDISGMSTLDSAREIQIAASATGYSQANTKQTTVGVVAAGAGLTQKSNVQPTIAVMLGSKNGDPIPTNFIAQNNIGVLVQSTIDAIAENGINGGAIIAAAMNPNSYATLEPTLDITIGSKASLQSITGSIDIQGLGGVDQAERPTAFDSSSDVDSQFDTITFSENHRLLTGDFVKYQAGGTTPISGLVDEKEYPVVWINSKKVSLGVRFDSDLLPIDLHNDRLYLGSRTSIFKGPFELSDWDPTSWDQLVYRQIGSEPVGGLIDGKAYYVHRINAAEVMFVDPEEVPEKPKSIDGSSVGSGGTFTIVGHHFDNLQNVTYRAATGAVFTSNNVNQTTDSSGNVTPETTASNTIYLGDSFQDVKDGPVIYESSANLGDWYWVEGPSQSVAGTSDLNGVQFWTNATSDNVGAPYGGNYSNWDESQPVYDSGFVAGFSNFTTISAKVDESKSELTLTEKTTSTTTDISLSAAWMKDRIPVNNDFTIEFTYQASGDKAGDGIALVFQNQGLNAIGAGGSSLGYTGITGKTAAYLININSTKTAGTGFVTSNQVPTTYQTTGQVNLKSGNPVRVVVKYDAQNQTISQDLSEMLPDGSIHTNQRTFAGIDLQSSLGNKFAYIGFTGSYGSLTSTQKVRDLVVQHSPMASYAQMKLDGKWSSVSADQKLDYYVIQRPHFVRFDTLTSWEDAKTAATNAGGWLASISSDQEWQEAKRAAGGKAVWLGGSDDDKEGKWLWDTPSDPVSNGKQFWEGGAKGKAVGNFTPLWATKQPDNNGPGLFGQEDALMMHPNGYWNDMHKSDTKLAYLVEFPQYEVIKFSGSFEDAREDASSKNGWVATVGSTSCNEEIAKLLAGKGPAWLGATNSVNIAGLVDGGRYWLERVVNDATHPNSARLYALTSNNTKGSLIQISGDGVPSGITNELLMVEQSPLGGLESGKTYYVIRNDADHFQLAANLEDAKNGKAIQNINGLDGRTGAVIGKESYLGTLGIDLTAMGQGKQHLVFDISATVGNHQQHLIYQSATNTPNPTYTGTARSVAHVAAGGAFTFLNPDSTSYGSPRVTISTSTGSQIIANDVALTAIAAANATSKSEAYSGGIVATSNANADTLLEHWAKVQLEGSIHATRDLIVETKVSDETESHSDTKSFGFVAFSNANSRIENSFDSQITVGDNATLSALETLSLNAYRAFGGQISATTKTGAAAGNSRANHEDNSGIIFSKSGDFSNTTKVAINNATLQANTVNLRAMGLALETEKDPNIQAIGSFIGPKEATSRIAITDDNIEVRLEDGATITARSLNAIASQDGVNLHSIASSKGDATAKLDIATKTSIYADSKSTVAADSINVLSQQLIDAGDVSVVADTTKSQVKTLNITPKRTIDWNAQVWGRSSANLLIDASRRVQTLSGITLQNGYQQGDLIPDGSQIVIQSVDQLTKSNQTLYFSINSLDPLTNNIATPNDTGHVWLKGTSTYGLIPNVEIVNQSKLNLVLPRIDLATLGSNLAATKPTISPKLPSGISSAFTFGTMTGTKDDGIINVQNTWLSLTQAQPTLMLSGPLTNKRGLVKLINLAGDILTTVDTSNPTITASIIKLEAAGSIGTEKTSTSNNNRIYTTLNASPYFGSALTADSKKSLIITVRPDLPSGTTSYTGIQRLAGDQVNIELLPSTAGGSVTYSIGSPDSSTSALSKVISGNSSVTVVGLDASRKPLTSTSASVSINAQLVSLGTLIVNTNGDITLYQNSVGLSPTQIHTVLVDRIISQYGSINLDFPGDLSITNALQTRNDKMVTWSGDGRIRPSASNTDNHPIITTGTLNLDSSGGTGSVLSLTPVQIVSVLVSNVDDSVYLFNPNDLKVLGATITSGNLEFVSGGTMTVTGPIDVQGGGNLTLAAHGSASNVTLTLPIEDSAINLKFSLAVNAPILSDGGNINLIGAYGVRLEPIYQIQQGAMTFEDARLDAQSRGGWLAPLAIESVNNWVKTELKKFTTVQEVWAGGSDAQQEGSWRWSQGPATGKQTGNSSGIEFYYETIDNIFYYDPNSTISTGKWNPDEPNNFNNNEDYLTVMNRTGVDGKWNDNNASNRMTGYVLQLPTVRNSGTGQIVVSSGTLITQSNAIQVGQDNSTIYMSAGAAVTSEGGNIVLLSTGDVYLGTLETQKEGTEIANQEAVLVVADYRGVDGSLPQGTGKIINNLKGGLLNIVADEAMFSAGGENESTSNPALAWTGVGQKANPIRTQVDLLAASSYLGGIYIENTGDLTIGQASLQMQGRLADVFNFRDAVPVRSLPKIISTIYSGRDPSDPYIGKINGRFTVGGLAIMSSTNSISTQADIRVSTTKSLLVEEDMPIFNQDAGQIVLGSLAPIDWATTFSYQPMAITRGQAQADAVAKSGWISAINGPDVNQYLSYLVNKNQKSVWIGATDSTTEGTWTWDLGTAQSEPFYKGKSTTGITQPGWYNNWNSGEPNDYGSNEDYAELIYSTTTTNARWNDKSNVASNTRPYVLQKDPGYPVTILSPMFSTAGTDAIKTIRGYKGLGSYKELAISVPIPEATCDTYYAMRMAQSDGSEAYKESLTYLLTLSSCEPYVPTGSGESPMLGSPISSGESMGPALRFFVSMDKQARDQAKYLDGSSTPSFPILSNEAGDHVIYARVLHPSGEFTDYQKTITIVDNPPEQISVDPTRTPLSVGQVAKATISFEDTNSNDQYMATLDWGDGTAPQNMELGATRLFNATHPYSKPGRHQVDIKLTDMSTGLWSTATTEFYIGGSSISAGQLQVIGSDQRDQITVMVEPRTTTVVTRLGNGKTTTARYATKDFSSLYVATFDGDDFINIVGGSAIPTRIESGRGNDYVQSGRGASTIEDLSGNNRIFAGSAADIIRTGLGNDEINAGAGDNQIYDLGGSNRIIALQGSDVIETGIGNDYIHAGSGHNTIKDAGGANQIYTLQGNDTIEVTGNRNRIFAGGGQNTLRRVDLSESNQASSVMVAAYGLDINGDGVVSPLDVLTLIDRINRSMIQLSSANSSNETEVDTDGDGIVSPLDVLSIIDYLNGVNQPGAEAESVDLMPVDLDSIRRETDEEYYDAVFAALDDDEFE